MNKSITIDTAEIKNEGLDVFIEMGSEPEPQIHVEDIHLTKICPDSIFMIYVKDAMANMTCRWFNLQKIKKPDTYDIVPAICSVIVSELEIK